MKATAGKSMIFIGKSMLWSLLLYSALMLALNWEEVGNTIKGRNAVTILSGSVPVAPVSEPYTRPASISADGRHVIFDILKGVSGVVRVLSGIGASYN